MLSKKVLFLFVSIGLGLAFPCMVCFAAQTTMQLPDVYVSANNLSQSDTLLVIVKNEPGRVTGKLGLVPIRFFRSENNSDWVGIVGIPLGKKPGDYKLVIHSLDKAPLMENITVAKRNFPVTDLVITPQLLQKGYTVKKIVSTIENKENKLLNKVLHIFTPKAYITKPFIYPLLKINVVAPYGDIRKSKNYSIQHLGVDLEAPVGTAVLAANDGKIVFERNMPDYGNTMVIDHGLGVYSLYLHLSHFNITTGRLVKQGDAVALSGDTGYVTGPHLHFSIKVRGASLDPLKFIAATQTPW